MKWLVTTDYNKYVQILVHGCFPQVTTTLDNNPRCLTKRLTGKGYRDRDNPMYGLCLYNCCKIPKFLLYSADRQRDYPRQRRGSAVHIYREPLLLMHEWRTYRFVKNGWWTWKIGCKSFLGGFLFLTCSVCWILITTTTSWFQLPSRTANMVWIALFNYFVVGSNEGIISINQL
jgi:hypothetical protein